MQHQSISCGGDERFLVAGWSRGAAAAAAMTLERLFGTVAVLHGRSSRKLWPWSGRVRQGGFCSGGEAISEFRVFALARGLFVRLLK